METTLPAPPAAAAAPTRESWRPVPVPAVRALYEVSSHGRVRRRRGRNGRFHGAELHGYLERSSGRRVVKFHQKGRTIRAYVDELVARAFLGAPPAGPHRVIHLDDRRDNDHVDNLRWRRKRTAEPATAATLAAAAGLLAAGQTEAAVQVALNWNAAAWAARRAAVAERTARLEREAARLQLPLATAGMILAAPNLEAARQAALAAQVPAAAAAALRAAILGGADRASDPPSPRSRLLTDPQILEIQAAPAALTIKDLAAAYDVPVSQVRAARVGADPARPADPARRTAALLRVIATAADPPPPGRTDREAMIRLAYTPAGKEAWQIVEALGRRYGLEPVEIHRLWREETRARHRTPPPRSEGDLPAWSLDLLLLLLREPTTTAAAACRFGVDGEAILRVLRRFRAAGVDVVASDPLDPEQCRLEVRNLTLVPRPESPPIT